MISAHLNRLVRGHSRAAVLWAMMPLAILASRPTSGCICADGHYEPFCRGGLHAANDSTPGHEHSNAASGACSCCDKCHAGKDHRSCCQGKSDCCRGTTSADGSDAGVAGKSCCTPVLRSELVTVVAASSQLLCEHQSSLLCMSAFALPSTGIAMAAGQPVGLDTGPPPHDLVVTLGRRLI